MLEHLEPKSVFRFFEEMSAIPHGSYNTKAISDWAAAFARERGLEYHQDELNNVVIIKEATPGYESAEALILQAHLDMVCEKTAECTKDMAKEGLDLLIDGDFVRAKDTTLGADNGIGVALALAALDDGALRHPRLEVVLTTEEEVGMEGVTGLDVTPLQGRQMINLDSAEEGVFTVGCSGGSRTTCVLPVARAPFEGAALRLAVSGLTGGHSGIEIDKRPASANMLMGRFLGALADAVETRIVYVRGGLKSNAIPRDAEAVIVTADAAAAKAVVERMTAVVKHEYDVHEPNLTVTVEETAAEQLPLDAASTRRVMYFLTCTPNGVQEMSQNFPGKVQTSLNLGVLDTHEDRMSALFLVRSAFGTQKEAVNRKLRCLMELLDGFVEVDNDYPPWEYRRDSALRERMVAVFREQYGRDPGIDATHAGLECGQLCGKLPGLDCVSIAPDLWDLHTPWERMSISSVRRVWAFLRGVLEASK